MNDALQTSLLPAGCQPWNFQVVSACGNRFAYCATLSVYIYECRNESAEYSLHSIISEHSRGITSIVWHPYDQDLICTTSVDKTIVLWNIDSHKVVAKLSQLTDIPVTASFDGDRLAYCFKRSPITFWNLSEGSTFTPKDYSIGFSSDVTIISFCPIQHGKVIVGHADGTVSFLVPGTKPQRMIELSAPGANDEQDDDDESPVINIQWDVNSADYALVVRYQKDLCLLDTNSMTVLMKYKLPSRAAHIQTVSWLPGAAGLFITGDQQNGILRIWNVSSSEPIESIKIKPTGFHAMSVLSSQTTNQSETPSVPSDNHVSCQSLRTPVPSCFILCTFFDGGVGLYDLQRRHWRFSREKGHIETVFDCMFSPSDPHKLATSSFDGSVKLWDISNPEMTCIASTPGNEGILYNISWAPSDLNCIAVASAKYGIFIWDLNKNKITLRYNEHGKGVTVYNVCWNQINTTQILSSGADCNAIVRDVDGKNVLKFAHPATVYGCEWSPSNGTLFATGCDDSNIRIFSTVSTGKQGAPIRIFSGHSAKSFHVRWSPFRDGYLASGSDDQTARVWSYGDGKCCQVLKGHKAPVRGLCWSPEIVYLLYSGSWDFTINLWDVRDGSLVSQLNSHGGDVYGLSIHPSRPFILASSSRDSTVRLWSTYQVAAPLLPLNFLAGSEASLMYSTPEAAAELGKPPLLSGIASDRLAKILNNKQTGIRIKYQEEMNLLFQFPVGVTNLFDLVRVILGRPDLELSEHYSKGILHKKHLTKYKQAEAMELDMVRMSHSGGQIGAPKRQDKLNKAAESFLKLGNIQKYCELMIENNQWERALSLAPAVSRTYWKKLLDKYIDHLDKSQSAESIVYRTARGDTECLINHYITMGQYNDALLTAVVTAEGGESNQLASEETNSADASQQISQHEKILFENRLNGTVDKLVKYYREAGQPILAACVYLSNNQISDCIAALVKGHCLELALSVASLLDVANDLTIDAAVMLALRCEKLNQWELAVILLKSVKGTEAALASLCIRYGMMGVEADRLRQLASLPSKDISITQLSEAGDLSHEERIKLQLLSGQVPTNLRDIISYLHEGVKEGFTDDLDRILGYVQSLPSETLSKLPVELYDILTMSCYIGAYRAMRRGYKCLIPVLLKMTIKRLSMDTSNNFPLTISELEGELMLIESDAGTEIKKRSVLSKRMGLYSAVSDEMRRSPGYGELSVLGCNLPSYSYKEHKSFISNSIIKGPVYSLEDGKSVMSLSEAIMWAQVNPFSPVVCLQSVAMSTKINPF